MSDTAPGTPPAPRFNWHAANITHHVIGPRHDGLPGAFPPHNPDFPDVNPATGDERETTEGPAVQ